MIGNILLILALAFAIVATLGVSAPRVHFGWLAVALYFASILLGAAGFK